MATVLSDEDRQVLNEAVALVALAKKHLERTWSSVRERYNLPAGIQYDRETGEVVGEVAKVSAGG